MPSEKEKPTKSAVEIMHRRYVKGKKRRLRYIEQEKERIEIAQKIYDLRTNANLTQKELAKRIGTRQSVISRLENAEYTGHTLKILNKIAEATNNHLIIDFTPITDNRIAVVH
jgi:ribosome-binding protein aMBF1 (putative translation factor)